jgi:hypothetical protein
MRSFLRANLILTRSLVLDVDISCFTIGSRGGMRYVRPDLLQYAAQASSVCPWFGRYSSSC